MGIVTVKLIRSMWMRKKNIAIITGASSGFGKEFVRLLAKERTIDEIWAVARDEKKLQRLSAEFKKKLKTFSVDLSVKQELESFAEEIKKVSVTVRFLINNAGYGKFGSYKNLTIHESVNMIDLNVSAVVQMGLICIPYMRKGSHIINIASQASFQPLPYLNIYSATKAFVRNYSRALHVELKEKGISVTAVCPGWMRTAFFDRAEIGAAKSVKKFVCITTPDRVAAKALADAKRGKDISVYGFYVRCAHVVAKLLPQKVMMRLWLRQQSMK